MNTNFIYTGGPFTLFHERAIRSAIATQRSTDTILWWNGTKPEIIIPGLTMIEYRPKLDVRAAVQNRDPQSRADLSEDHWMRVVTKDVMFWELASTRGGLFLDLDTTCLSDVTQLLGSYDIVSPIDVPWDGGNIGWRNVAVLITRPGSEVANACLQATTKILLRGGMSYFELGPKILTDVMNARGFHQVYTPPHRMLGGFCGGNEAAAYLNGWLRLESHVRVVHWFSSSIEMFGRDSDTFVIK